MAGYSGTPLVKKLGIKPGFRMHLLHIPAHYPDLLEALPADVIITQQLHDLDLIHVFVRNERDLQQLASLKDAIKKDGMIWVSWEKKKVKQLGAVNENLVRAHGLPLGLVDVKVCAVDENWSALKLVWRKENR